MKGEGRERGGREDRGLPALLAHLLHGRGSVVDETEGLEPLLKGVGLVVREGEKRRRREDGGEEGGEEEGRRGGGRIP
jgi:hypothetical protein